NYKMIFLFITLLISIWSKCPYKFSPLSFSLLRAFNLHGYIPAITIIDKVFYRKNKMCIIYISIFTIIVIINRYKSNPHLWKNLLKKFSRFNIVSSKS